MLDQPVQFGACQTTFTFRDLNVGVVFFAPNHQASQAGASFYLMIKDMNGLARVLNSPPGELFVGFNANEVVIPFGFF